MDDDYSEVDEEVPEFLVQANHDAKLKELLHRINSLEIKLCSDATKEFIKFLKGQSGREWLYLYVKTSSKFTELLEAWKLRQGKPGMSYVMKLISAILGHSEGIHAANDMERIPISRALDRFAQLIIKEKLGDVYKELNSKESKRQNCALLLMASIVRRGSGLATEVAKSFDFKLQAFSKLAEYRSKKNKDKVRHSARKSLVEFAMSFLEVGKPGLLRWILQQKEMYSGVLRGLANDDEETIVYVLSTLRDRVLTEESLVPPGLRSVLFGSVTLEQLVSISGRSDGGHAAELAHSVLLVVCIDPSNGLMPDVSRHPNPLKGNPKRLLGLMKKLKATEMIYHRDLLLAIVRGRPLFGSAYMEDFPYSLEDHTSPNWLGAVTLAAKLVSSVGVGFSFEFLVSQSHDPPSFDSVDVQNVINCICPHPVSRSVINKGLLHTDILVKHGILRLLLEALKLLDSFLGALNHYSSSDNKKVQTWENLKQEIRNKVRIFLPDPQVLLTLLSPLSSQSMTHDSSLKRSADPSNHPEHCKRAMKKLKRCTTTEDTDIIVGGITASDLPWDSERMGGTSPRNEDEIGNENTIINIITDIWDLDSLTDVEIHFHTKLLGALKLYLRTMPNVLEGSFDFLMNLLNRPLAMPTDLQYSLLSLLKEYIGWCPHSRIPTITPPHMYKHLQLYLNLLINSHTRDIKDQAYDLSRAAMLSTGAFDRNGHEVDAWFVFLPGYRNVKSSVEVSGADVLQSLSPVVVSFLCDAISTVGNNLFKYWDILRSHIYQLEGFRDLSPDFSPLIICVLQKIIRLLNSSSGTFKVPEKSMISLYVCNTLKYLIQIQVDARLLSAFVELFLCKIAGEFSQVNDDHSKVCEWRPLENLLLFSQSISLKQSCVLSVHSPMNLSDASFTATLREAKRIMRCGCPDYEDGIIKALYCSIICTSSDEILENFPSILTISPGCHEVPVFFLSSIFFCEHSLLAGICNLWPDVFFGGLEMAVLMIHGEGEKDDACENAYYSFAPDENDSDPAAAAFKMLLTRVPFHVLFPTIMSAEFGPFLLGSSKLQDLLVYKLSNCTSDSLIPSLRILLFWIHQIRSLYCKKQSVELEQLSETCSILISHLLENLSVFNSDADCSISGVGSLCALDIHELAETVFYHPGVIDSLTCPLECNREIQYRLVRENFENYICSSGLRAHKMDQHILNILTSVSKYLLSPCNSHFSKSEVEDGESKRVVTAFNSLILRLLLKFKEKFDFCIEIKDWGPLLPIFYSLQYMIQFVPPVEMLELVNWIFSRFNVDDLTVEGCEISAISCGCYIASRAFESLSCYLLLPPTKRVPYDLFWKMEEKSFDINLVEELYMKVLFVASNLELHLADECLLSAISLYRQQYSQYHSLHSLSLVLPRVVASTPVKILSYCIRKINMKKAKILYLLTEVSPLHLTVFGNLLLDILNKEVHSSGNLEELNNNAYSDESFLLLLPPALSYLKLVFLKRRQHHCDSLKNMFSHYSRILLNGFRSWKSFVAQPIFVEEYDYLLPSSLDELLNLFYDSLLGKAINMLHYHFTLSGDSLKMKKRIKLFNTIVMQSAEHEGLLDCDANEVETLSVRESLNLINRVVAKISICMCLLFPEHHQRHSLQKEADGGLKGTCSELQSNLDLSRLGFMENLVSTWHYIVRKFPSISNTPLKGENTAGFQVYRYLEVLILRIVLKLTTQMHDILTLLQSIPYLERLVRSALLYRFEDPTTLEIIGNMINLLSDGKLSPVYYIQLLLSHSQFPSCIRSVSKSIVCPQIGAFSRPMSSILRSLVISSYNQKKFSGNNDVEATNKHILPLQVIKLLKSLFQCKGYWSNFGYREDIGINLRELQWLLLSSYGATLSELDLQIYDLMNEIDSVSGSDNEIATKMDYLWGSAALKIKKERSLKQVICSNDILKGNETTDERWRSQFRESFSIDPKICAATVLYFPFDRTTEVTKDTHERHSSDTEDMQRYDPVYILRFSIHNLSRGYLEPMEFASLGLLAVAFISLSSPDHGIRRLAYETLGRFKDALEECQKKKDVTRVRLLLTNVQNGIEEAWQKIPSIVALFAAESSLILLDPSHDHYAAITKLLMRTSKVNMKCIPLFQDYFWSSSVNFKMEKLWILRLACAGLNSDDDAQIYIRNGVPEVFLSFCASPVADDDTMELILQIVKRSVKLHKMARYLVEHCGLFPWLSSIVSTGYGKLRGCDETYFFDQLTVVVKVVHDVISSRNVVEWLQACALEQLMELSSHLFNLLIADFKLMVEGFTLFNSIMAILTSVLKISQKRKLYQPHFTLSVDGLFQIYQAVDAFQSERLSKSSLEVILMSTPPLTIFSLTQKKLTSFISWAIATARKSDSAERFVSRDSDLCCRFISEGTSEDSLTSKLLRWLTASVILGKLSCKTRDCECKSTRGSEFKTLESLLEHISKKHGEFSKSSVGSEDILAARILYLQLSVNDCCVLPSVVSALCFLLFLDSSSFPDFRSIFMLDDGVSVTSLLSKIHSPPEACAGWRWSFYQPWKNLSMELTYLQKIDELQACQTLLFIISNALQKKSLEISCQYLEIQRAFTQERSMLEA